MKDAMHDVLACHGMHTTRFSPPNDHIAMMSSVKVERAVRHSHASAGVTSTHHMHAFKIL
jgi:hypothetical protein